MNRIGNNLDGHGESYDDKSRALDYLRDDDYAEHAPSDYVIRLRAEREERKRRDREDLVDLWREETLRRRRERAPLPKDNKGGMRKWRLKHMLERDNQEQTAQ